MQHRFTLTYTVDGISAISVVENPINWKNASIEIERDDIVKGLIYRYTSDVKFIKTGYDNLYNAFISDSCNTAEVLIETSVDGVNFNEFFLGQIILSEVDFDLDKKYAECTIEDNTGGSRILRNKKQAAYLNVSKSLNGEPITGVTPAVIDFFNDGTGAYTSAANRDGYSAYDAFEFLIAYMTDGEIGFESTFFADTAAGQGGRAYIFTGLEISTGTSQAPNINFEDLFREMHKRYNIGFALIESGGVRVVKIENAEYFYQSTSSVTLNNVKGAKVRAYTDELYSSVVVGGTEEVTGAYPEDRFVGFEKEDYSLGGKCQKDNELDLLQEWISDSNVVNAIALATDTWDEDIIVVECDAAVAGQAIAFTTLNTGTTWNYNESHTNYYVLNRHFRGIPTAVIKWLNTTGNNDFLAKSTAIRTVLTDTATGTVNGATLTANFTNIMFDDDYTAPNFDTSTNYGGATVQGNPVALADSYYTVPASGAYSFSATQNFNGTSGVWVVTMKIEHYRSTTLISSSTSSTTLLNLGSVEKTVNLSGYFYINDFVCVTFKAVKSAGALYLSSGASFLITALPDNGGNYVESSLTLYDKEYEFTHPVSESKIRTILSTPYNAITFNRRGGGDVTGWINESSYSIKTGLMSFKLLSE